jgi:hypothetical protein
MTEGEMIANFNTAPPPGIWIIWAWIGVCFLASAVLIVLDALLRPRVLFGFGILENERRRREDAEETIIHLESKVSAHEIRISYLEGENETLRELARRRGFKMTKPEEDDDENNDFGRFGFRHAQPDEETDEAEWMNRKFEN